MKSKLKKVLLALGFVFLAWGTREAVAGVTSQGIAVKVSISNSAQFTVNKSTWNFGALAANATSVSTDPIVVNNDSGGITQTYKLTYNSVSPTTWTPGTAWNTSTNNEFVLGAIFDDNQPANSVAGTSFGDEDVITAGGITADGSNILEKDTGAVGTGFLVPGTGDTDRNLWFRIEVPATTTDASEHTIHVTLSMQ